MLKRKRVIFLLSHPIQYFSPLFQKMAQDPNIDLLVLYCSDENVKGHIDKGFGVEVKWDIDLLKGYNYKFLKNNSWKPSIFKGFFGLINLQIFQELKSEKGSYLVIHGWNYFTHIFAIIEGKLLGYKVCIRGDNPYNQEIIKNKKLILLKKYLHGNLLFNIIDFFLYVGKQNKEYYKFYGVPDNKLIFVPHAVDNARFRNDYEKYKNKKPELRKELRLPEEKIIILFSGKFIHKKKPMDLLAAYNLLKNENAALIFLGDGELRKEMEEYAKTNNLKNVLLTGFKNQSEIGKYFAIADIFVLPSGSGETWDLVVNEAMNFELPIIVSDLVGCGDDLVKEDYNGFKYPCGNIEKLKNKLELLITDNILRAKMGSNSLELIPEYSYGKIINSIIKLEEK